MKVIVFPTTNDRRHDIGIFGNYVFNNKIDFSATWLFGSGNTVTLPSQKYYSPALPTSGGGVSDGYSEYISTYNGYKMPVFHRLDLGVNLKKKNKLGRTNLEYRNIQCLWTSKCFFALFLKRRRQCR